MLVEDFRTPLASIRARQSLDQQVETIMKAKASTLADRKALQSVSTSDLTIDSSLLSLYRGSSTLSVSY